MADIKVGSPENSGIITKYADQGDGTHALVVAASVAAPVGGATEATLATRLSEADFDTKTGSLTESAPATDTASSGINGRLQRIAQRITSLIALLPAALVSGRLDVNIGAAPATLSAGGDVAHDGVDAGNPVKIGYKAVAHGTTPTAVAAADRVDGIASRHGVPYGIGGHPNTVTVAAKYTAAQTNTAIVSVSAGSKIVVTGVMVTANNANTVNVGAVIGFATATTPTTTGVLLAHGGLAPGSGVGRGSGGAILGIGADDEDVRITSDVPTTGDIWCVVTYYVVPS